VGVRRIVVHIEHLVLKGFRHEDRHAIATGLQRELKRLLEAPGMPQRLARSDNPPRLRVGPVIVAADATLQRIGAAIAKGIGKGLRR
jgi:hypothetical protein